MAKILKELYNLQYIEILSNKIIKYYPNFKYKDFNKSIFNDSWTKLELKQRMRWISTNLYNYLPKEYNKAIKILISVFNDMPKFYLENMIFQDYVEVFGLEEEDFEISMDALETFTIDSSSEFAIRVFLIKYRSKTISRMKLWSKHSNEHIRRLSSEGTRPRLPWAISLEMYKKDPSDIIPILENLQDDNSKYVQKSVANNLNDISKDNPKIVKQILKKWIGQTEQKNRLLKHGLRTLLKEGDQDVLELFGYNMNIDNIKISNFVLDNIIAVNQNLNFKFKIYSNVNFGQLKIEYAIYYLRKDNSYFKKIFKIEDKIYNINNKSFSKYHLFKEISTRKYYYGKQYIAILINSKELIKKEFILVK